ncbi:DUF3892 domain-containing protein [Ralstonia solanacearum]|uniref:DUF3892 domain-containing protein n=1 Tax=Ralstonia solanacearum TaxID=305 RepID=UPI0018D1F564|nr:DUF3892 domain-containing protein [Ralstonia solanacearum]
MEKWADYLISAVQFNAQHTHINQVQVLPDLGDTVGQVSEHARETIVSAIKKGTTFVTAFQNGSGKWLKGKEVFIVPINGVEYIKTVADNKLIDNLDNLPEF